MQRIITHISSSEAGTLITLVTNLGRLAALDRHTSTSMSSPCTRRLYWGTPVGAGGPNTSPVGILNLAPCQWTKTRALDRFWETHPLSVDAEVETTVCYSMFVSC